jgi:hypothetical protein
VYLLVFIRILLAHHAEKILLLKPIIFGGDYQGNFSSDGVILVTIMRSHSVDGALVFEVAEEPKPGQVRVLLDFGGNTELLHLAASITAAELWIAKEGYRNARLEIVGDEQGERAGGADLAA